MDLDAAFVNWDADDDASGNAWHIAPTSITQAEVEAVIRDTRLPVQRSRSTGLPLKVGRGADGREIVVVWREECDNPPVVHPVTAYYRSQP